MRLIDVNELRQQIYGLIGILGEFGDSSDFLRGYSSALRAVLESTEEMPTIDTDSLRPHGKWERVISSKSAAKWSAAVSCFACHSSGHKRYKYCPHCGAKMEDKT